jgi:hypothetical protein
VDGGGDETKVVSLLHPYMVEVYVARDKSEACLSLNPPKAFCTHGGAVKEVQLELAFSRYETYEDKTREVHRQKELLAFTTAAKEYVRVLQRDRRNTASKPTFL